MDAQELGMALVAFLQKSAQVDRSTLTRAESMASMYGEACTKEQAAKILSCSARTITEYVYAGKLKTCCEGKKIDVRSIAAFIESKPERRQTKRESWMV